MHDPRCPWCLGDPLYETYHDTEWGVPQTDPRLLFELLMLEGFQAGLSWITILKRRENFRAAFAGFDPHILATWGAAEVESLLKNAGIIRHRGKIEACLRSAHAYLALENSIGFSRFLWQFVDNTPLQSNASAGQIPAQTPASQAMSRALKKAGFGFCGPTICYAFMQAAGLVNDHLVTCPRHAEVAALAR